MKREIIQGRVSIIVPCYNSGKYVKQCLDSLLAQTYKNIEIIVIEDGSTDTTWKSILNWRIVVTKRVSTSVNDDCLISLRLPRNVGYAGALTTGMFMARGEFIAIQDSDDLSHPERIERQVAAMRKEAGLGLIGTSYEYFRDGNFENRKREGWLKYGKEKIQQAYKNGEHCICHGTILFRSKIFDQLGGLTRRIEGVEDYDFIARCVSANTVVDNLKEALYYYRQHDKQRSLEYFS